MFLWAIIFEYNLKENKMKYIVLDSLGNVMGKFHTYQQASTFKFARGNYGWSITFRNWED